MDFDKTLDTEDLNKMSDEELLKRAAPSYNCKIPRTRPVEGQPINRCSKECTGWILSMMSGWEPVCEDHGGEYGPIVLTNTDPGDPETW